MADNELRMTIRAKDEASGVLKGIGDVAKTALGVAIGTIVVPALKALAGQLGSVFTEAGAAEDAQARLNTVLKSTGGIAGVTAQMANELATSLGQVTRFEDDTVLASEALLLTFTNIGKDVFPQAIIAATDMATVLKTDLDTSIRQLGRALNDPIQGMSALTRMGVQFSEEQKKVITALVESGNVAGAQAIILEQLRIKFGGAAEAAGATFAGQLTIAKNNIGNLKEAIGLQLIPALTGLIGEFNSFVTTVTPAISGAIGMIWREFAGLAGMAEDWGKDFGLSFARGIASAIPYIVGVIRAISRILAYWFAPGSPPKIAEDIDEWGKALVQEYFKAFSGADLSSIIGFSRDVGSLLQDALSFGLIGEGQAAGMLAPLKAQFAAMFAELGQTGTVGAASFAALRGAAGPLGAQVERTARGFLDIPEGQAASPETAGAAAEKATDETKALAAAQEELFLATATAAEKVAYWQDQVAAAEVGTLAWTQASLQLARAQEALDKAAKGAGASVEEGMAAAQAAIDGLDIGADPATGESPLLGMFDAEAINARAEEIASGITGKLFPMFDALKLKWQELRDGAVAAFAGIQLWLDTNLPVMEAAVTTGWQTVKDNTTVLTADMSDTAIRNQSLIESWMAEHYPLMTTAAVESMTVLQVGLAALGIAMTTDMTTTTGNQRTIWEAMWGNLMVLESQSIITMLGILSIGLNLMTLNWRGAWLDVKELARSSWEYLKDVMDAEEFVAVVDALAGEIVAAFGANYEDFKQAGKSIVFAMIDGVREVIRGVAPEVVDTVKEGVQNAIDALTGNTPPAPVVIPGTSGRTKPPPPKKRTSVYPRLAGGTSYWGGGMALVGEQGAELVSLPMGSSVLNAEQTSRAGGTTWNVTINSGQNGVRVIDDIRYLQMLGAMA